MVPREKKEELPEETVDPYAKFREQPDSSKWSPALTQEYNDMVRAAYALGFSKGDPRKACENTTGTVLSSCNCQHCTGARGAYYKQSEVTGYTAK